MNPKVSTMNRCGRVHRTTPARWSRGCRYAAVTGGMDFSSDIVGQIAGLRFGYRRLSGSSSTGCPILHRRVDRLFREQPGA
jgi:hypothetical protein